MGLESNLCAPAVIVDGISDGLTFIRAGCSLSAMVNASFWNPRQDLNHCRAILSEKIVNKKVVELVLAIINIEREENARIVSEMEIVYRRNLAAFGFLKPGDYTPSDNGAKVQDTVEQLSQCNGRRQHA